MVAKNFKGVEMSYAESQKKFCRFVAGHYVVMTRAWKNGEWRFGHRWVIKNACYIGRKLLVIKVFKDAIQVQAMYGHEPFFVPWFVLEDFRNFQPIPMPPVATNDDPKKDVIESIEEGMALKVANYKGRVTQVSNPVVATKNLESGEMVYAMDIAAVGGDAIKSESVFAGFWRDGAVVKPGAKHRNNDKCIFAVQKRDNSLDICLENFDEWESVFWLDTTTPTELTPQEAFELLRIVYPQLHRILDEGDGFAMMEGSPLNACINWNGETQYPPREYWRVPTDADKGSNCRCWDNHWDETAKITRRFLCINGDKFVVVHPVDGTIAQYDKCEVVSNE